MRKYNINDFYVGVLNFPLDMGNLLYKYKETDNQEERRKVFSDTVTCGAIDLRTYLAGDDFNWQERQHTIKLYTIFHKVDDVHYLCLHNKKYYNNGIDYCDNLVRLVDILPKIDIIYNDSLSYGEAIKLFKYLFQYGNYKICNSAKTNFKIDDFYHGCTSLCTVRCEENVNALDNKYHFMNLPEQIIYNNNSYLYQDSGFSRKDQDNKEYFYSNYHTLFIKTPNGKYYSLNDYRFYNLDDEETFNTEINVQEPFAEELEKEGVSYSKELTIPKVLKLQKKLYDRK